jgi:hypothetical protein
MSVSKVYHTPWLSSIHPSIHPLNPSSRPPQRPRPLHFDTAVPRPPIAYPAVAAAQAQSIFLLNAAASFRNAQYVPSETSPSSFFLDEFDSLSTYKLF